MGVDGELDPSSSPKGRHGAGRYVPAHRKKKLRRRRALAIASAAAIVAGLGIAADIGWFYVKSDTTGGGLLAKEKASIAAANPPVVADRSSAPPVSCAPSFPQRGGVGGIVSASTIGLQAPVVQGQGDAQLAVAVGHDSRSVWPGQPGTAVLSAHDVSWFSRIDQLAVGTTIEYQTTCATYYFTVSAHKIVASGSPVYNTSKPSLVMSTCYPLDALWITSKRYLVYADLTKIVAGGAVATVPSPGAGAITTSLPAALVASVAARVTTSAPLGPLTLSGTPTSAWAQSDEPINAAGSALQLYFGTLQLAAQRDYAGFEEAAPGLSAGGLWGETVASTIGSVTPTLQVAGTTVTAATVTSQVRLSDGAVYGIDMSASVIAGRLSVSRLVLSPG